MRRSHILNRGTCLIAAIGMVASPALAADDDEAPRNAYLESLRACQAITVDAARLACLDEASSTIIAAADQGDLSLIDREEVRETRRSLFGFSLPKLGIFGGGKKDKDDAVEEMEVLQTTISGVRSLGYNGWQITTAEGAVWQIDDAPRRFLRPRVGQKIEMRKAALGSFFIEVEGQLAVKGKRVG